MLMQTASRAKNTTVHRTIRCCSSTQSRQLHVFTQDRITRDGSLVPAHQAPSPNPRSPLAPAAPVTPPATDAQIAALVELLTSHRRVTVLTGAGCSTESNIPDYRSPNGAYSSGFKPMTHQKFMSGPRQQARYWARSFAGWYEFENTQPNQAHYSIAALQARGWLGSLITQNVDRLHTKAGSRDVIELHGTTHEVVCMSCRRTTPRADLQHTLSALNPQADIAARALAAAQHNNAEAQYKRGLRAPGIDDDGDEYGAHEYGDDDGVCGGSGHARGTPVGPYTRRQQHTADHVSSTTHDKPHPLVRRPDGDVEIPMRRPDGDVELVEASTTFTFPACHACGGVLKPAVVFFGDGVDKQVAQRALDVASSCDAMLVVGSSLMVYSAYRLVKTAVEGGALVAAVTAGPTRADDLLSVKVEARAGEVLTRLERHEALQVPRLV